MEGIVSNIIRTIKEIQFKMFILLEICWIDYFNALINVLPIEIKSIKLGEFRNMFCANQFFLKMLGWNKKNEFLAVWVLNANFAWKSDPWKSNPNSSRCPPRSWLFCTLLVESRSYILPIYNTMGYRRLLNKIGLHFDVSLSNEDFQRLWSLWHF